MTTERLPLQDDELLRGVYELDDTPGEIGSDHRRQFFPFNRLNKLGKLYEPVLDYETNERAVSKWPSGKSFAVCLTHDVDHVTKYAPRQAYRNLRRTVTARNGRSSRKYVSDLARNGAKLVRDSARSVSSGTDPLHCYERWLEMEATVGATSTFFFMPNDTNRPHFTDNSYIYTDEVVFDGHASTVGEMMRDIHERGWEVGLHPTWNTVDDARELRDQKRQAESVIGAPIESVRHHYLHYDLSRTPTVQSAAGFRYDSTLGFNGNVGFRFGTSRPWHLYDWEAKQQSDIIEVPLIAQDVALFRPGTGLGLDRDTAVEYLKLLARRVKRVGGVLTLSWHPSYIRNDDWRETYETILAHLDDEGAWFGTVAEIGDWWENIH